MSLSISGISGEDEDYLEGPNWPNGQAEKFLRALSFVGPIHDLGVWSVRNVLLKVQAAGELPTEVRWMRDELDEFFVDLQAKGISRVCFH